MIDIKLITKPISEPIRYNAYYKLVIMLAIIKYCSIGKKAPLQLIHLVYWGLRTEDNYAVLFDFSKQYRNTLIPWSFEEGVEKILSLSFINGYCEKSIVSDSLEVKITNKGEEILNKINELKLFEDDLNKIISLGKIAKGRINNANKNWVIL